MAVHGTSISDMQMSVSSISSSFGRHKFTLRALPDLQMMELLIKVDLPLCSYGLRSYGLCKGAEIFNGRSGILHLHYAHLAHYHTPQNTDFDPLGCVGVRQSKKNRVNLTRSVCARCGAPCLHTEALSITIVQTSITTHMSLSNSRALT